jgi:hypothetical protein
MSAVAAFPAEAWATRYLTASSLVTYPRAGGRIILCVVSIPVMRREHPCCLQVCFAGALIKPGRAG